MKNTLDILMTLINFILGNLMKCQKKVLKIYLNILLDVSFNGHCLIQNNLSIPKKVINIHLSYILNQWPRNLNADFRLGNSLFTSVKLTMNADPDKYLYKGYANVFNLHTDLSLPDGKVGKISLFLEMIRVPLCVLIIICAN